MTETKTKIGLQTKVPTVVAYLVLTIATVIGITVILSGNGLTVTK